MAQHLAVDPAVIAVAESLFFDVREMLQTTVWIHTMVVMRLANEGDADLAAKLKTAFYGGPAVAKALCGGEMIVPKDQADRLFAQELLLHAKFTAAIEFPLSDEQNLEFLKLFVNYKLQMEKLKQRREAFAHRCQEDVRRYELRKQRLAVAAARCGIDSSANRGSPDSTAARATDCSTEPGKRQHRHAAAKAAG
jgi:hypothetical protein